jgi:serine-type D-Ala-D-Ala carboxypeptidase/endopeptidase
LGSFPPITVWMSLPSLPISDLLVTSLALAGITLPVVALLVFALPYVIAAVIALFRRDPDGPFIARTAAARSRGWAVACLILSVLALVCVQPRFFRPKPATAPAVASGSDAALQASIASDVQGLIDSLPSAGVVVGVVQPTGNQVFGFGLRSVSRDGAPDGETVFEIGDMTQVFTGLLLARLAEQNVVHLDQPVLSLLPDTVSVPMFEGRPIELQHLATWSSGLPRLAQHPISPLLDAFPPFSRAAPFRSKKWLYDLLSSLDIAHAPGTHMDGSDLGMGLLGHALERACKSDYETVLEREICGPLGLRNTRVQLTQAMRDHLAEGMRMGWGSYRGWRVASPAHRWPVRAIPGANGLCSTTDDLLTLLRAHLAGFPMATALAESRRMRSHVTGGPDVGLGWFIEETPGGNLVWQHGAAGASRGYMAFLDGSGVGVVVLANAPLDIDLLGKRILNRLLAPGV